MKRFAFLIIVILVSGISDRIHGQETLGEIPPELQYPRPLPARPDLPANIFLYNYKVSLLPAGRNIFDAEELSRFERTFIPDMQAWQSEYYRNNFTAMSLANPTLANGNVMGYAMAHQTEANMELYLNYMLMNRGTAGRTQQEMMNVRMRNIGHINVVGAGIGVTKLAVQYFTAPETVVGK